MKKIKEFLSLLWLRMVISFRNFVEYLKVIYFFYSNSLFRKIDVYLLRNYILNSPYQISKNFLIKHGSSDVYAYGETPLTTLQKIADETDIKFDDVFYELGSGRGRSCFWVHCFKKCRVVGVEFVPDFVRIARKTAVRFGLKDLHFVFMDILEVDISPATIVYFYGTCADEAFVEGLIEKLKVLPPTTKIITVSYPLSRYTKEPLFDVIKSFPAEFTWGQAQVYIQKKKR